MRTYMWTDASETRCTCKGCGNLLWRSYRKTDQTMVREVSPKYGCLTLAMRGPEGALSEHSTPSCRDCAERLIASQDEAEIVEWWKADAAEWMIEAARAQVEDPLGLALQLVGNRAPVRALRYEEG